MTAHLWNKGAIAGAGLTLAAVLPLSATAGAATTAASTAGPKVAVVASGLNNPRSLAWRGGHLYVSEAGLGGTQCRRVAPGPMGKICFGITGSISRIDNGRVTRVVRGLASILEPSGEGIVGPDGLSSSGRGLFTVSAESAAVIPAGLTPALASALHQQLGHVLAVTPGHRILSTGDPGDFDYAWAARHKALVPKQFPDADPYALLVRPGRTFIADAGSNTLDVLYPDGRMRVLAFLPNPRSSDAVPTCVAQGPDGALYIGELTGAGNPAGAAKIYRYTRAAGLTVWKTGFSAITGCGFGSNGDFYATEFDLNGFPPTRPNGAVVQIAPNGTRTMLGVGKLFFPNGFLAGPHGAIYVTNWSIQPGTGPSGAPTGEVVRIG